MCDSSKKLQIKEEEYRAIDAEYSWSIKSLRRNDSHRQDKRTGKRDVPRTIVRCFILASIWQKWGF